MTFSKTLTLGLIGWASWINCATAQEAVVISEFVASSDGAFLDEDGAASDWVEVFNGGSIGVDLGGWHLTDDPTDLRKWTFPATNLAPQGFLVTWASGKDRAVAGAPLHTNFKLASAGGYLALVHPDGVTIASQFAPAYPAQHRGFSYGTPQAVSVRQLLSSNALVRVLIPTSGTLGLSWVTNGFDDAAWLAGTNGVGYESSVTGWAVHSYKANILVDTLDKAESVIATPSEQAAVYAENTPVVNYVNSGDGAHYGNDRPVPGFDTDTDDYVIEAVGFVTIPQPGPWTFGVSSDDGFRLTVGEFTDACDCLRGPGDTLQTFNFSSAGDYPIRLVFFERGGGSEVEVYAAFGILGQWDNTFSLVGDTANGGLAVRSQTVGSSNTSSYRSNIRTDVKSLMLSNNATAYIRLPFSATNIAALSDLSMTVHYDDGFVAYLNGTEVARRNAPNTPAWDSTATASHSATGGETISLSDHLNLLQEGANLLAIQGLNDSPNGSAFLLEAELAEIRVSSAATEPGYFAAATPGEPNVVPPVGGFVVDPVFTPPHGFYDTNLTVSIICDTPGASIYYTLNGSVPTPANGFAYSAPVAVTNTSVLRAGAFKDGQYASATVSATYIFLRDVIREKERVAPGPGWPAARGRGTGAQTYDYGLDAKVVASATVAPTIVSDLKSLPTFSLVMDLNDLFDPGSGIYANAYGDTIAWERPASLELIQPDGSLGFQVNCGARIRGGYSRSPDNPKHGFRIFFRSEYGPSSLSFPLLSQPGTKLFQKFDIRTFQNYSWSFDGDSRFIGLRDIFSRDTQLAMGQQGTRGDLYHFYINGAYWGIYNTDERAEANFGAAYFGGSDTNYDTIKVSPDDGYVIYATDGDMGAWTRLWEQANDGFTSNSNYFRVQGLNPDGTPNPAYENLIDVDNLIDYMLVILYTGNLDAPISNFLGNQGPNNFFAVRDRTGAHGGFRFMAHDSEHTLLDLSANRIGPFPAGNPTTGGGLARSNPQYFWQQMWGNTEFRIKVADHAQKHFFNNGALAPNMALARLMTRSNEIYQAINAESARWGNANHSPSFTRNDWLNTMKAIAGTFIPRRVPVVIAQLKGKSLFPTINAPLVNQFGGLVPPGFNLSFTNSNAAGTVYYTLDGSDPRLLGGALSSSAVAYTDGTPVPLAFSARVRARVLNGTTWSALIDPNFYITQDFSQLAVSEIMYDPPASGVSSSDALEFLELKNIGNTTLDLSGLSFSSGLSFAFTNGTRLEPGAFFVLGADAAALAAKYPGLAVNGIYSGKLSNKGDTIAITNALGGVILSLTYNNKGRWPITAAGWGFSLVPAHLGGNGDSNQPSYWRASTNPGGSPGADDPEPTVAPVIINEILASSVPPATDAIELLNPTATPADIGNWWLTDDSAAPMKFHVPPSTTIPAGGFLVFTEADFNPTGGASGGFALSASGEQVYLCSGDATGLTGYSYGFAFGASPPGVTIGRYVTSSGDEKFELQTTNTLGTTNSGPQIGPVVIHRVMYHPVNSGTADNTANEFIELVNISDQPVALFDSASPSTTWQLRGDASFVFPPNVSLAPGTSLVLAPLDPADPAALAAFHGTFPALPSSTVLGPWKGSLGNASGTVEVLRPDSSGKSGVAYIRVDRLDYANEVPWPASADGGGAMLERLALRAYGNDPTNWAAKTPIAIWQQPTNLSVRPGSPASFSVVATGTGTLAFQWLHNGVKVVNEAPVSGADSANLSISDSEVDQAGTYAVQITDALGTASSLPASLTVLVDPAIVANPQSQSAVQGTDVTLAVSVTNNATLPLTYVWQLSGQPLLTNVSSQYTDRFTITNIQNGGLYSVQVKNASLPTTGVTSSVAQLTVLPDSDGDHIPDAWEVQYGLNPNSAADGPLDNDGDGMSNLMEYLAGTDPTDPASVLRIIAIASPPPYVLSIPVVAGRSYTVQYSDDLPSGAWLKLRDLAPPALDGIAHVTDTNAPASRARFYRLVTPAQP